MDKKGKGKRTGKATEDERGYNYESFFRTKRWSEKQHWPEGGGDSRM